MLPDLRYAVRSLARSPAFTLTASVTLALGLGAAIAALNLTDKLLRQPLGVIRDQDRMIVVRSAPPPSGRSIVIPNWVTNETYWDLMDRFRAVGQIAGYQTSDVSVGRPGQRARLIKAQSVTGNYFDVLGVTPVLGSVTPPPELAGGENGAVISDRLWAGLFGRRPDAIGAVITIEGSPRTVIGVTPAGFTGTELLATTDVWFPRLARGRWYYQILARLEPGASFRQAEGLIKTVLGNQAQVFAGLGPPTQQRAQLAQFLQLGVAGSLLVLLIACANVANLLLFRGLARRPETALHRALGASAGAVVRRHVTEAMMLAVPALLVGIPVSILLTRMLGTMRLSRWAEPLGVVPIDWMTITVAALGGMLVAGAAGVVPALVASRTDPLQAVQNMGRAVGAKRLRQVFATSQVALSLSLVVAMFLMVGTMLRLRSIDLGFDPRGVHLLATDPGDAGDNPDEARAYFRNLLARFEAAPEFAAVAVAGSAPLAGSQTVLGIRLSETPGPDEELRTRVNRVSGEYFDLLSLRILEGRTFAASELFPDSAAPRKIILSKSVAAALFGDRPVIGQTVYLREERHEVIGVAVDSHWDNVEPTGGWVEDPRLIAYVPFEGPVMRIYPPGRSCPGTPICAASLLVRPRISDGAARAAIQRIATEVDPRLPAYDVTTLDELVNLSITDRIVLVRVMTILGLFATGLAAVGVYGMVAYTVASRRKDLGIRIALGAVPRALAGLLLREVFLVGSIGIVVGLAGAVALSQLLASRLYGVTAIDATTYALAAVVLLGTAVLAAVPAIVSATRVDPVGALRSE